LETFGWQRLTLKFGSLLIVIIAVLSCGGNPSQSTLDDLCNCKPKDSASVDFRHAEKHIPLPSGPATPVTVQTILSWTQHESVADGPRQGRENTLFQVKQAYLQWASVQNGDCDLHLEISATPDKNAPRVMVETPVDAEYCPARQTLQAQLKQHGRDLSQTEGGELPQPFLVTVQGLAFEDFEHNRGTALIATTWELHPAIVTLQ
jgi:hypothetical protein